MKNNTKITAIVAVSNDGVMRQTTMGGSDKSALILLPPCRKYIYETIGIGMTIMDYDTYFELNTAKALPNRGVILFGISKEDWRKHYSEQDQGLPCCTTIDEAVEIASDFREVYLLGIRTSFFAELLQFVDEIHYLRVDTDLKDVNKFTSLPKLHEKVWKRKQLKIFKAEKPEIPKVTLSLCVRKQSYFKNVKTFAKMVKSLWSPGFIRNTKKMQWCIITHYWNSYDHFAAVQYLLGERFEAIYTAYEKALPTYFQEYATNPSFTLSEAARKRMFFSIILRWIENDPNALTISNDTVTMLSRKVHNDLDVADIMEQNNRKHLSLEEVEQVLKKTFKELGIGVKESTLV